MIPYLLGGAAAIGALVLGTASKRKRRHDPRTAATQRLKIVDARHAVTRRMAAVNPRVAKTHLEFIIQGNYGYGWDDENTELTWPDARRSLREYRENGGGQYRVVKRRVKNDEQQNPRRRNPDWRSEIPRGYKSRAARRLARELKNGANPVHALGVARVVARQGGDHVALRAIDAVLTELKSASNMSLREGENRAREVAIALGSGVFRLNPPKRRAKRRVVKVRRKVDGKWRTTTTVTRTVKKVKTNPKSKRRRK